MTNEEIAEKYAQRAEFQRRDGLVSEGIQVTHWEHNVKELIIEAISESTQGMWNDEDMKQAFLIGVGYVGKSVDNIIKDGTDPGKINLAEKAEQMLIEYKKQRKQ